MTASAEEKLRDDLVALLDANKVVNKQVLSSVPGADLELIPGTIVWWSETRYPSDEPRAKGASQPTAQIMWIEEIPHFGVVSVGGTEDDAIAAFEEAKLIIEGYFPSVANHQIMYPFYPVEMKRPLAQNSNMFGVVGFFAVHWQYQRQLHF